MGRYRRHLIGLAVIVVLVGAYAAAGFLAVPHYLRRGLQDFVTQHYHRTLTIGEIHCNPFTLTLEVGRLSLPDADGATLLSFRRLRVGLQLASLWRLAPSFREILLEDPYVRVLRYPDGALNLADLGKGFPEAPPAAAPSKPVRLFIARLAVIGGVTILEDRVREFRAELKPIGFELRDFSTTANTGNDYTLNAASPEGERLAWRGTVGLAPLASQGAFEITDLKASTLWRYLRDSVNFEIGSGVIALKGDYAVTSETAGLEIKLNVASTELSQLGVRPKGAAEDVIDVARLMVNGTHVDLLRRAVQIDKVELAGGEVKAWLGEQGRLNLLDLAGAPAAAGSAPASADAAAQAAAPPAAPAATEAANKARAAVAWTVAAPDIAIRNLKLSAEDRQVKPPAALRLDPINVTVTGFNTRPDDEVDVAFDSGVNGSGKLTARAHLVVNSGALHAQVEAADLGLPALQPYLAAYTSMTLLAGTLGTKLDIDRDAGGALAVKGGTRVSGLKTVDNALKQDFVKWQELAVKDISYRSQPASLRIGSVTALKPYVRMIIAPDRTVNIVEILKHPGAPADRAAATSTDAGTQPAPPAARAPAAAPKAAPAGRRGKAPAAAASAPAPATPPTPFPVAISRINFVDASVNYADLWIKPSFAVGIQSLEGAVTGLSSDPKSRARVELNGKVERYSPVHIGGEINLLSAALYTNIVMSFKDLDLTIVNPYSRHFAGYQIDRGKLSVDVSYKIDERKLAAEQHFVVDQLELGERIESPDAVHLPLKIAVALLKDRNGVIDIDLPLSGSIDDPSFRVGPLIWKAFVNLIGKIATAPFALLGHLFGGGEHMNVVAFAAGSAELDPPSRTQLGSMVKALQERPQLKLDVPMAYSPDLDRPQLAAAQLQQQLAARLQQSAQGHKHPELAAAEAMADPRQHFQLLVQQYQADLGKDAPLPPAAAAAQAAKDKEAAPYDEAVADLQAALLARIQVPDADLEGLGKRRALAIQDALLSGGAVDAARVFIVKAAPQPPGGDKVRVEMAVK